MQVLICELVGNFAFALLKDDSIRNRFATTLIPVMANGEKGLQLSITRM